MDRKKLHKLKGFTLLELIIVMAIVGVLAAIIIPNTVSRMRDAKIESSNTKAQEVYTAFQNYLTNCQIKRKALVSSGTAGESPAFPNEKSKNLENHNVMSIIFYGALAKDKYDSRTYTAYANSSKTPSVTWGFDSASPASSGGVWTAATDEVKDGCISGITSYLGSGFDATTTGAFGAIIDVDTYTVIRAWYSETETAYTDVKGLMTTVINGGANVDDTKYGALSYYTQIFGKTGNSNERSQEIDTINSANDGKAPYAYIGQYPIGE